MNTSIPLKIRLIWKTQMQSCLSRPKTKPTATMKGNKTKWDKQTQKMQTQQGQCGSEPESQYCMYTTDLAAHQHILAKIFYRPGGIFVQQCYRTTSRTLFHTEGDI